MTNYTSSGNQGYNLYNFEHNFKLYLIAGNANPVTLKNYLSDFRHFWGWVTSQTQHTNIPSSQAISPAQTAQKVLAPECVQQYKNYLINAQLPPATINRRLSTLRKFAHFCVSQGWISLEPSFTNAQTQSQNKEFSYDFTPILKEFGVYLKNKKYKKPELMTGIIHELIYKSFRAK